MVLQPVSFVWERLRRGRNGRRVSGKAPANRAGRKTPNPTRPRLEALEGRIVPATVLVGPTRTFTTISAGVAAAQPGDTVQVDPGTYKEQVTITKNLTLTGNSQTDTTLQAPATLTSDASGKQVVLEITGGASVSVTNLTVAGPGNGASGVNLDFGIFVSGNASLNLSDAAVTDIRQEPLSGAQTGIGIVVGSSSLNQVGHATISNVTVSNYQKAGISISAAGSTATVQLSTVIGIFGTSVIAQNGIQVGNGGVATITHNQVNGNAFGAVASGAAAGTGILLLNAGAGTTVTANIVSSNDTGISSSASSPPTIASNILTNNRLLGVQLGQGSALVQNNSITGGQAGVGVLDFPGSTADAQGTLTGNLITNTGTGIVLQDANPADATKPVVVANFNKIFSNGVGLDNQANAGSVQAEKNWWGTPLGPGNPTALRPAANPVNGTADTSNWATSADFTSFVNSQAQAQPYSFVTALYRDLLHRAADGAGLDAWVAQLQAGAPRTQVAAGVWRGAEHRGLEVDQYFQTYLKRSESAAERNAWVNGFLAGADETSVQLQFLTSAEFNNANQSNDAFVTALYQDVLGRPSDGGKASWVQALQLGARRSDVALAFLTSDEKYGDYVDADFQAFLGRPSDQTRQSWVNAMHSGQVTPEQVGEQLLGSQEYYDNRGA